MSAMLPRHVAEGIRLLEGAHLDVERPPRAPECSCPGRMTWIRIRGVARTWEEEGAGRSSLEEKYEQFLQGLFGSGRPCASLILGEPAGLSILLGLDAEAMDFAGWRAMLQAAFPGCETEAGAPHREIIRMLDRFREVAALTGNPSVEDAERAEGRRPRGERALPRIGALIRAMEGCSWAYLTAGLPLPEAEIDESLRRLMREEREVRSAFMRKGSVEEGNNPEAQHYVDLLAAAREKHEAGRRQGMWSAQVYLLADSPMHLRRGTQALTAVFAGPHSRPQPVRVRPCLERPGVRGAGQAATRLTSAELALLACLPGEEFAGYALSAPSAGFAVSPPAATQAETLCVGAILSAGGQRSENWFQVGRDDLCKHAFVAGTPGSGKSETSQYLLRQLWEEQRIPWLVIEPSAKSEYRRLLRAPLGSDLLIFTLGDETGVPFRLNPLEVPPGIHVQTHIDGFLALCNAAFALYPPMPSVLNEAVYALYERRGWDLTRGTHPVGHAAEAQPTLSDLYRILSQVIESSRYSDEIKGNIQAGLQTRLASLMRGSKGAMLNSGVSLPLADLLARPTILEMAAMGDDDEKAFMMGAILLGLSEQRQREGLADGRLRHVTLIEEAHRLLRAVPETVGTEVADPRGKGVEIFCNMLAEMRALGEGFIVVDQIPAKLASDVIKNTALKIAHRLVAEEDRRLMGGCMSLTPEQERALATLTPGQAVAYAEGRPAPYQIRVPHHARHHAYGSVFPGIEEVRQHMQGRTASPVRPAARPIPPTVGETRATCPGCGREDCPAPSEILRYLDRVDETARFNAAVEQGRPALWRLAAEIAAAMSLEKLTGSMAPRCVLIMLARLVGLDEKTIETYLAADAKGEGKP